MDAIVERTSTRPIAGPAFREPNAVDFWRGFALLTIFINHVPGNAFEPFTYSHFSISDAAELFVFLAGWAIALAVRGRQSSEPRAASCFASHHGPSRSIALRS